MKNERKEIKIRICTFILYSQLDGMQSGKETGVEWNVVHEYMWIPTLVTVRTHDKNSKWMYGEREKKEEKKINKSQTKMVFQFMLMCCVASSITRWHSSLWKCRALERETEWSMTATVHSMLYFAYDLSTSVFYISIFVFFFHSANNQIQHSRFVSFRSFATSFESKIFFTQNFSLYKTNTNKNVFFSFNPGFFYFSLVCSHKRTR